MTVLIDNRKAHFNYEVISKYEAGIELFGFEVKSVLNGRAILAGAFAIVRGGEVYLMNMQIPPYQVGNTPLDYDPTRTRKLLLSKKQIKEIAPSDNMKGLTLVPLSLYSKGRLIKVELAVVKGKKNYDKRETIKKRDVAREIDREYKR
jgi:SsrA-binding protein